MQKVLVAAGFNPVVHMLVLVGIFDCMFDRAIEVDGTIVTHFSGNHKYANPQTSLAWWSWLN